jgi:hypothetical protein
VTLLRHISGRAAWLALGVIVALAIAFRHEGANALESWQAGGVREIETAARYQRKLDSLQTQWVMTRHHFDRLSQDTARLRETLRLTQAHADELAHQVDSAYKAPLSASVRRIGEACGAYVQNCESRVLAAKHEGLIYKEMYDLASPRLARADSIIRAGLKLTDTHHFHVGPLTLPKPRKWMMALLGCSAGAYLDQRDRLRGCGITAAGLTVVSPTW